MYMHIFIESKSVEWMERISSIFDYDSSLIPPDPSFFSAGFLMDKEDK